jgi:hypothetical protein
MKVAHAYLAATSYPTWRTGVEMVSEVGGRHPGRIHVRQNATGALVCGMENLTVQVRAPMPIDRDVLSAANIHKACYFGIPNEPVPLRRVTSTAPSGSSWESMAIRPRSSSSAGVQLSAIRTFVSAISRAITALANSSISTLYGSRGFGNRGRRAGGWGG